MTIKKSKNYWEKRAERQEKKVHKEGDKLLKELDKNLNNARKEIQKSINDLVARYMELTELCYTDAMRNLTSSEFREWRMTLEEYMAEIEKFKGIDEKIADKLKLELETLAMKSRISRLDTLKAQIDMELNRKSYTEHKALKGTLETVYNNSYRDIRLDFGVESSVAYLDKDTLSDLINYPWSGTDFSNRIWENRAALGRVLKEEIIQSFIQGISVKDLTDKIMNRMNSDRKNTERLVRTELNYALNQATKKGYEDSEVEEYEYLAEIDSRTSPQCRELNGKIFKLKDAKVGINYPPMHPHCRSTTIPVIEYETLKESKKSSIIKVERNYENDIALKTGKEFTDEIYDRLDRAKNKELRDLYRKYIDRVKVGSINKSNAYCSNDTIYFNKEEEIKGTSYTEKYSVFFHESGHALDNLIKKKKNLIIGYSAEYKEGLFPETLTSEVNELVKNIQSELKKNKDNFKYFVEKGYFKENEEEFFKKYPKDLTKKYVAEKVLGRVIKKEAGDNPKIYSDISDIFSGVSKDKFNLGYGHSSNYWKQRMIGKINVGLAKEAFAEMTSAELSNSSSLEIIKKYLPNSYKVYCDMIKEAFENEK